MGDIIVISVLAATVCGIVFKMRRDKKAGKGACGCDCSKCSKCCTGKEI